mmetsp:Transcript_52590/g.112460  ORF Transcript_52590/g.112460 Transcript_52590/m.112460 type:complete len:368 (+) Transcript_52590:153-1256(+)
MMWTDGSGTLRSDPTRSSRRRARLKRTAVMKSQLMTNSLKYLLWGGSDHGGVFVFNPEAPAFVPAWAAGDEHSNKDDGLPLQYVEHLSTNWNSLVWCLGAEDIDREDSGRALLNSGKDIDARGKQSGDVDERGIAAISACEKFGVAGAEVGAESSNGDSEESSEAGETTETEISACENLSGIGVEVKEEAGAAKKAEEEASAEKAAEEEWEAQETEEETAAAKEAEEQWAEKWAKKKEAEAAAAAEEQRAEEWAKSKSAEKAAAVGEEVAAKEAAELAKEWIQLEVKDWKGRNNCHKVKRNAPLGRLMNAYCNLWERSLTWREEHLIQDASMQLVRFKVKGERIERLNTPEELQLEDWDVIYVTTDC